LKGIIAKTLVITSHASYVIENDPLRAQQSIQFGASDELFAAR